MTGCNNRKKKKNKGKEKEKRSKTREGKIETRNAIFTKKPQGV